MQKLTTFFRAFWKSISSFTYYRDVVKAPFSFSLKYFLLFSLLTGFTLTLLISMAILPAIHQFLARVETRAKSLYPQDLTITIKDGELATSATEPLHFPIPFELFTDTPPAVSDQNQMYLLTIDTGAQVEDYKDSKSLIFVTKKNVVVTQDSEGTRIYDLKEFDDATIDKKTVDEFFEKFLPLLKIVPVVVIGVISFLLLLLLPLLRLAWLMILTLPLLMISSMMKLTISYGKLYQIGLHALTLPTLIQFFTLFFGLVIPIPFFHSLLYILYSLVILAELKKSQPPATPLKNA